MMDLPYDDKAERIVLAALLVNPDIFADLELTPADFYIERHRIIFKAIERLHRTSSPIDANTVADALPDSQLRYVGGPAFSTQLLGYCPAPTGGPIRATLLEGHNQARILQEMRQRRTMLLRAQRMATQALNLNFPVGKNDRSHD